MIVYCDECDRELNAAMVDGNLYVEALCPDCLEKAIEADRENGLMGP